MSVRNQTVSELCPYQNPLTLALEWGLEPLPFGQGLTRKPLFHTIVLSQNSVQYKELIGVNSA